MSKLLQGAVLALFTGIGALRAAQSPPLPREDLVYRFPTANHSLIDGRGEDFFMYCDRNFEGQKSKPWEAGGYGMVRNPFRASDGKVMFSRIHEGVDIKPTQRDAAGEPLDLIHPIAPGVVVYTNPSPTLSNYGRYVVVGHRIPEGVIYSLYAHLARVDCRVGQRVGTGNVLGQMGHSGAGINRERSHVHLELALMLHSNYDQFSPPSNKHGLYNGLNLAGIDPVPVLRACAQGQPLSIRQHWASLKEHYRVRVPYHGERVDMLRRYPFLLRSPVSANTKSMDVAFTAEGVPLGFYPSTQTVPAPSVISCLPAPTLQQNITVNRLKNSSKDAALTASGLRYIQHIFHQKTSVPSNSPSVAVPSPPAQKK